jgi:hypothetical protein
MLFPTSAKKSISSYLFEPFFTVDPYLFLSLVSRVPPCEIAKRKNTKGVSTETEEKEKQVVEAHDVRQAKITKITALTITAKTIKAVIARINRVFPTLK